MRIKLLQKLYIPLKLMSAQIYLIINAIIYFAFAFWCLLKPTTTANFSGLSFLSNAGRAEYIAIYVGLQLSFAVSFLIGFLKPEYKNAAILYSVLLYAGVVIFRWISIIQKGGLHQNAMMIASLEIIFLIWGIMFLIKMK